LSSLILYKKPSNVGGFFVLNNFLSLKGKIKRGAL